MGVMKTVFRIYPKGGHGAPSYTEDVQTAKTAALIGQKVSAMTGIWKGVSVEATIVIED